MAIKDDKARIISIVDKEVKTKLEAYATKDKRSLSAYVAILLENWVTEEEKKNK